MQDRLLSALEASARQIDALKQRVTYKNARVQELKNAYRLERRARKETAAQLHMASSGSTDWGSVQAGPNPAANLGGSLLPKEIAAGKPKNCESVGDNDNLSMAMHCL